MVESMNIRILKSTREIEIPDNATVEELKVILGKFAPFVAGDDTKTAYKVISPKSKFSNVFDGLSDIFSSFGNIFNAK